MALNSASSSSICSGVRWASGLSVSVVVTSSSFDLWSSQLDLDWALGGVDAGADHLALRPGDLSVSQVANLTGAQLSDAGVADALPASEGQLQPGLLTGDEDGRTALCGRLAPAGGEGDGPALPVLVQGELRLEALHVEPVAVPLPVPVVRHRIEHVPRAREEGIALAPVGAQML